MNTVPAGLPSSESGPRAPNMAVAAAVVVLIVGQRDEEVLALNEQAARQLTGRHEISIIPGATHLFAEPGALEPTPTPPLPSAGHRGPH